MVNPGEGLAENIMSSDRKSGEGTGDTSDEVDMLDMLDRLLVGPAGRLEKYVEGLNDRPRLAIFQNAPTRPLPGRIDPHSSSAQLDTGGSKAAALGSLGPIAPKIRRAPSSLILECWASSQTTFSNEREEWNGIHARLPSERKRETGRDRGESHIYK